MSTWRWPICYWSWHQSPRKILKTGAFRFFFRNFGRPFTPRTWLRSARNSTKTRFRRFPSLHLLTPRTTFWSFFPKKQISINSINRCFGGATIFWASLADSSSKVSACNLLLRLIKGGDNKGLLKAFKGLLRRRLSRGEDASWTLKHCSGCGRRAPRGLITTGD